MKRLALSFRFFIFIGYFLSFLFFFSCKKELKPQTISASFKNQFLSPTVLTVYGVQVDSTINAGGIILTGGNDSIIAVGMCWSKNHQPRLSTAKDSITKDKLEQNQFRSLITKLKKGETYYGCAYITTAEGLTLYGQEVPMKVISNPLTQVGVVLAKTLEPQSIDVGFTSRLTYNHIGYKSDTSGLIIKSNASSHECIYIPKRGVYTFTSTITLTSPNFIPPESYPLHFISTRDGEALAITTAPAPGLSQLCATVLLEKGDSVSVNLMNSSANAIFVNPSNGMIRFEGYLIDSVKLNGPI